MTGGRLLDTTRGAEALAASLQADPPRRVLVIVRGYVGDAVMSTGAVRAVLDRFRDASVTLETSRSAMPVFDNFPGIAARRLRRDRWEKLTSVVWLRRSRRFDLAVILDDSRRRARIARWGGVRRVVGVREDDDDPRFTASVRWSAHGHDLLESLHAVVALVGANGDLRPRIFPDAAARSQGQRALASVKRPAAGLFVDAARDAKRWPLDRFVELSERLEGAGCATLAIAGLDGDRLLAPLRARGAAVPAPLGHPLALAELIRGLAVLVTNDTGAAHLADAVGTPAVVLYGPTSPQRFAPFGDRHRLLHAGFGCDVYLRRCDAAAEGGTCDQRCIRAIGVDEVFDAAMSLVARRGRDAAAGDHLAAAALGAVATSRE